jgi:hypothetical protein
MINVSVECWLEGTFVVVFNTSVITRTFPVDGATRGNECKKFLLSRTYCSVYCRWLFYYYLYSVISRRLWCKNTRRTCMFWYLVGLGVCCDGLEQRVVSILIVTKLGLDGYQIAWDEKICRLCGRARTVHFSLSVALIGHSPCKIPAQSMHFLPPLT